MKKLFVVIIAFLSMTMFVNAQTVPAAQSKPAAKTAGNKASATTKAAAPVSKKTAAPAAGTVHLKKDGTVDKRFKSSQRLKKDGTPDMRYKENKKADVLGQLLPGDLSLGSLFYWLFYRTENK